MKVYIQEWPHKTATIILSSGEKFFNFPSLESATNTCRDWYTNNFDVIDDTQAVVPVAE